MSFEIGAESFASPSRARGSRRVQAGYPGLGATAMQTLIAQAQPATAPWMVGLPKAGDSKDNTRIAYAKRDHDLALSGNATAYANLKAQAAGSATKVGKAWYNAALNDVNNARVASAPKPVDPLYNPAGPPTRQIGWKWTAPSGPWVLSTPINVNPIPLVMPVLRVGTDPIVKQATDMGFKIQQTADGNVVAVDSNGAVVSKPLPLSTSQVTDSAIVPSNAVQANAPPPRARPASSGILSILDKLSQQTPAVTSSDNFVAASGAPMPNVTAPTDAPPTTPTPNTGDTDLGAMFKNPLVLAAVAVGGYLLFATGSGRRR